MEVKFVSIDSSGVPTVYSTIVKHHNSYHLQKHTFIDIVFVFYFPKNKTVHFNSDWSVMTQYADSFVTIKLKPHLQLRLYWQQRRVCSRNYTFLLKIKISILSARNSTRFCRSINILFSSFDETGIIAFVPQSTS